MWQALVAHGMQRFDSVEQIEERMRQVDSALSELCFEISRITGDIGLSGFERARALRTKPEVGGKSPYECVNQLIHYWYCCAAARHLVGNGYIEIQVQPTGHDNVPDDEGDEGQARERVFDLEARHPSIGLLVAEVFCVSVALWPQKMNKTRKNLSDSTADVRLVYYNREAKQSYCPKMERIGVFGVIARTGEVQQIFARFSRQVPGVAAQPGAAGDVR